MTTSLTLSEAISAFDLFLDGVFARLRAWEPTLTQQLELRTQNATTMSGSQLIQLIEQDAKQLICEAEFEVYGAGFCASPLVVDQGNPLAWWQGSDLTLLASSTFGPGQAEIDLSRLEWYRVPRNTLQPHVAGPFVDYLCSNQVTLTLAQPIMLGENFGGVACADVLVETLERKLMPLLSECPGATLVNSFGRTVVSTDFGLETGDRYPAFPADDLAKSEAAWPGYQVSRSARYPYLFLCPEDPGKAPN